MNSETYQHVLHSVVLWQWLLIYAVEAILGCLIARRDRSSKYAVFGLSTCFMFIVAILGIAATADIPFLVCYGVSVFFFGLGYFVGVLSRMGESQQDHRP